MRLKAGDIFTIPVSEQETGYGQIINIPDKSTFIIVVFQKIYKIEMTPVLEEICKDDILFGGYTMDALLYHKKWVIIGNFSLNIDKIKLPYYKLGTPPNMRIVDFKAEQKIRDATKEEFEQLDYLTVVAPIRFQLALQAYHKMGEWKDYYSELYYERVLESIRVVEKLS
jgi:hypothetical protein